MAHSYDVLSEIIAALRLSTLYQDLTSSGGTHRVLIADGGLPESLLPVVLLAAPDVDLSHDASLREYHVTGTINWWGWAAAPSLDLGQRIQTALELADQVVRTVQTAHATPANVTLYALTQLLPRGIQVFGEGRELPDGAVMCSGQIVYQTDLSLGV